MRCSFFPTPCASLAWNLFFPRMFAHKSDSERILDIWFIRCTGISFMLVGFSCFQRSTWVEWEGKKHSSQRSVSSFLRVIIPSVNKVRRYQDPAEMRKIRGILRDTVDTWHVFDPFDPFDPFAISCWPYLFVNFFWTGWEPWSNSSYASFWVMAWRSGEPSFQIHLPTSVALGWVLLKDYVRF